MSKITVVAMSDEFADIVKDLPELALSGCLYIGDKRIEGSATLLTGTSWEEVTPHKVSAAIAQFADTIKRNFRIIEYQGVGIGNIGRSFAINIDKLPKVTQ